MHVGPGLYSRFVAILKVGLPLIAVAMLAGLFLNSEARRGGGELVFSPADLALLGEGMRVTGPVFSGVTDAQDRFRFTADAVTPDAAPPTRAGIETLTGVIDFANGQKMDISARGGEIEIESRKMTLRGAVRVETSDGYVFSADVARLDFAAGDLSAEGAVSGDGPIGRIDAGRLTVSPPSGERADRTFLFQDNVRVVYDPPAVPAPAPAPAPTLSPTPASDPAARDTTE